MTILPDRFARDHWSMLYCVAQWSKKDGGAARLRPSEMRDKSRDGQMPGSPSTDLLDGTLMADYDDYDVLGDLSRVGYLVVSGGGVELTELGRQIAAELDRRRMRGESVETFRLTRTAVPSRRAYAATWNASRALDLLGDELRDGPWIAGGRELTRSMVADVAAAVHIGAEKGARVAEIGEIVSSLAGWHRVETCDRRIGAALQKLKRAGLVELRSYPRWTWRRR